MAGLTLTALVVVLQFGSEEERGDRANRDRVIGVAMATVASLLICSFLYAQTTGEERCAHGIADAVVVGPLLGAATVAMFVLLSWIIAYLTTSEPGLRIMRISTAVVAELSMLFNWLSAPTVLGTLRQSDSAVSAPAIVATACCFGLLLTVAWAVFHDRNRVPQVWAFNIVVLGTASIVSVGYIGLGFADFQSHPDSFPIIVAWLPMVLATVVGVIGIVSLPAEGTWSEPASGVPARPRAWWTLAWWDHLAPQRSGRAADHTEESEVTD